MRNPLRCVLIEEMRKRYKNILAFRGQSPHPIFRVLLELGVSNMLDRQMVYFDLNVIH